MMNPIQIIQMIKGGRNPQQMINQLMSNNQVANNPMIQNAFSMYKNGDNKGLQKIVENMCRERGMTLDDLRKQLGI